MDASFFTVDFIEEITGLNRERNFETLDDTQNTPVFKGLSGAIKTVDASGLLEAILGRSVLATNNRASLRTRRI